MKKLLLSLLLLLSINLYAENKNPHAILETTQGLIELELYPEVAPKAVENFMTHIKNGYYNGIAFHRIIKGFMIQGGDPSETGRGGESIWNKPFADEFKGKTFNKVGILAMANAGPQTNGSQFFITTANTPWLNGYHTIFGQATEQSMQTIKKLDNIATLGRSGGDRPLERQEIIKAYIKK
ncbi:MAG: peptidylprolyl isomerase [Helicobacteraceae bacterium CG2_30_36_10]|nr:MAG: peptidylprolyl isomerase [Helicobacteraceae bacterium CG2_30_36_10]